MAKIEIYAQYNGFLGKPNEFIHLESGERTSRTINDVGDFLRFEYSTTEAIFTADSFDRIGNRGEVHKSFRLPKDKSEKFETSISLGEVSFTISRIRDNR